MLHGYQCFTKVRRKLGNAIRNSGGICVLIKEYLIQNNIVRRIFDNLDECIVLLLNGKKFENQNDIILIFTYISPEGSSFYTNPNDNGIELLANKLVMISSEYQDADFLLAGDFNARTKTLADYIVDDDTDFVFGEHTAYPADTFSIPRNNLDSDVSNAYGLSLIEMCSMFNIHILNGRLFNDLDGNYTCFANNGTSVVDYIIASTTLFSKFTNFGVDNFDISDHMPIYCTLTLNVEQHTFDNTHRQTQGNESYAYEKYKWKHEYKDAFLVKFRESFRLFQQHFINQDISKLTKCYEPLQKLRVRLGTCKTGLSPPVTLCY